MAELKGGMKEENKTIYKAEFSRREFFRGAGLVAGIISLVLTAVCNSKTQTSKGESISPSTPSATTFKYVPQTVLPPLVSIPGTSCTVATDRVYSVDHIWVKTLANDRVVLGISTPMYEILSSPVVNISIYPDMVLEKGDTFGTLEGEKMISDLICPLSGDVIQLNNNLFSQGYEHAQMRLVQSDLYNSGWLMVMRLSNPEEMHYLLSPQGYVSMLTMTA